jgi:hypothetical protein
MTKSSRFGASRALQFRAEFYNLFNQAAWTNVNATARFDTAGQQINTAFGTVMPTGSARIVQLSLRFAF